MGWTAEGVYLSQTSSLVAKNTGVEMADISSGMAAVFGFWSLAIEFVVKLAGYGMEHFGVPQSIAFGVSCTLAIGATLGAYWLTVDLTPENGEREASSSSILDVVRLWPNPRIWLISFMTISFSISGAFVNGIVASQYVKPQLGAQYIALFSAAIAFVGTAIQYPLKALAERIGKGSAMGLGSLSMVLMGLLAVRLEHTSMGFGLLVFYVLQGVSRGNNIAVDSAVYVDHFKDELAEPAFANKCMVNALFGSAAFFLQSQVDTSVIGFAIAVSGACVVPGYVAARIMQVRHASSHGQC